MAEKESSPVFNNPTVAGNTAWRTRTSSVLHFTAGALLWFLVSSLWPASNVANPKTLVAHPTLDHHVQAPHANLWKELSVDEMDDVIKFLHSSPNMMNLSDDSSKTLRVSSAVLPGG